MKAPQDFITEWTGKRVLDGSLPLDKGQAEWRYQCVSLIKQYLRECCDLTPGAWGNAIDYLTKPNPALLEKFDTTGSKAFDLGDIVILDGSTEYEHIGIGVNPTQVLEQNGGRGSGAGAGTDAIRVRTIKESEVLGVLKLKGGIMKPREEDVWRQWITFGAGNPSPKQVAYYTSQPWNVLNEDLLVWNRDERKRLEVLLRDAKPGTAEKKLAALKSALSDVIVTGNS